MDEGNDETNLIGGFAFDIKRYGSIVRSEGKSAWTFIILIRRFIVLSLGVCYQRWDCKKRVTNVSNHIYHHSSLLG